MSSVSHRKYPIITNSDVDALEEIGQIDCSDIEILWIEVHNLVGGGTLTDFDIAFRTHGSGNFVTLYSATADYTSPSGPLLGASADPATLVADASALLQLNVRGIERIKISAAGTNSSVSLYPRGA